MSLEGHDIIVDLLKGNNKHTDVAQQVCVSSDTKVVYRGFLYFKALQFSTLFNPYRPSVKFHIETRYLFYSAK